MREVRSSGVPQWVGLVYVALFAASIPWYLPDGPVALWLGLPYWVVVSLCAVAAVSIFTFFVVRRYWRDVP